MALFPESYSFPTIPSSSSESLEQGLTQRPTFFGCNDSENVPLVIYLGNGGAPLGQVAVTNTTTSQFTYQASEIQAMLNQIFDIATQGIPVDVTTKDPEWPACLACAVVDRTRAKLPFVSRSGVCSSCFERYCA